jgi:hypothetical protein
MEDLSRARFIRFTIAATAIGVGFIVWFALFTFILNSGQKSSNTYTDKLSGELVNLQGVATDNGINPDLPFFVGFNYLTKYGVSDDDIRYIQDVLTNYTLYIKNQRFAKISYVNKSYIAGDVRGTTSSYGFKIGINDGDVHTVTVDSDIVAETITINIKGSSGSGFSKDFAIYPLS